MKILSDSLEPINFALKSASIVLALLTFIVFVLTMISDHFVGKRQEGRISAARIAGEQAAIEINKTKKDLEIQKERTAEAVIAAERARESAALALVEANKTKTELAQAEIARLKIEERLAYRTISDKQAAILKQNLVALKGKKIAVCTVAMSAEISAFAARISKALTDAGMDVDLPHNLIGPTPRPGLRILASKSRLPDMQILADALVQAGIATGPVPCDFEPSDQFCIIVGSRE